MTAATTIDSAAPGSVAPEGVDPAWDGAVRAAAVAGDAGRALDLAREIGRDLPQPGAGRTAVRWARLRELAAADLTAARVVEAHTDALAILAEARHHGHSSPPADTSALWGVFAAEGPDVRLDAEPDHAAEPESAARRAGWRLTGGKPWCSLADRLDRALVTAHVPGGGRRLFAIDLADRRVTVEAATGWAARGLVEVPSMPITLDGCPAQPVGPVGWYLDRPGFAWGGMGVAACWLGGAIGLARSLHRSTAHRAPDQIALMHLGAVDATIVAADAVLTAAGRAVDGGTADGPAGALLAARVRAVMAGTVETVVTRVGHALGPAPLAFDPVHARRVADLQLYVRQHHAERDEAALGAQVRDLPTWF